MNDIQELIKEARTAVLPWKSELSRAVVAALEALNRENEELIRDASTNERAYQERADDTVAVMDERDALRAQLDSMDIERYRSRLGRLYQRLVSQWVEVDDE